MINRGVAVLLVLCTFALYSRQQLMDKAFIARYVPARAECVKESGITDAYLTAAWKMKTFPNDQKLKCYFKCMQVKFGVLDATGDVVDGPFKVYMEELFNSSIAKESCDECSALKGPDLCDTAFKLMSCVLAAIYD